jgi:signal transduction histidine kinase
LIFDKYYRSPNARRRAGTGLGLYLVKSLIQVLNGSIDYVPSAQHLRFIVILPLWQDA